MFHVGFHRWSSGPNDYREQYTKVILYLLVTINSANLGIVGLSSHFLEAQLIPSMRSCFEHFSSPSHPALYAHQSWIGPARAWKSICTGGCQLSTLPAANQTPSNNAHRVLLGASCTFPANRRCNRAPSCVWMKLSDRSTSRNRSGVCCFWSKCRDTIVIVHLTVRTHRAKDVKRL